MDTMVDNFLDLGGIDFVQAMLVAGLDGSPSLIDIADAGRKSNAETNIGRCCCAN